MDSIELKKLEFIEESKSYFDHYPFMSPVKNGELDGNAILYAGSYGLVRTKLFGSYEDAQEHSIALYKLSYIPDQPGLITRGVHKFEDPQTHDDYVGMCTISFLDGGGAAKAIRLHGRTHANSYHRKGRGVKEWFNAQFYRIPGLVQHIKLCAGETWSAADILWWFLGVYFNAPTSRTDESGLILKWHMVSVYELAGKKNWLSDIAVKRWKTQLIKYYPAAMGEVFGIYYSAAHLFSKWMQGRL